MPFFILSIETASSKSLAVSPSMVKVRRPRRSILPSISSALTDPAAASASFKTRDGNFAGRPNLARITSASTSGSSGSPMTLKTRPAGGRFLPGHRVSSTSTIIESGILPVSASGIITWSSIRTSDGTTMP